MTADPTLAAPTAGYMTFVGVSTGSSSITRVFPRWAEILGLPTRELVGIDLPLEATAQQYRETIIRIRDDADNLGALITTHKMGVYAAAHDLFDDLDDFSLACAELSSVSKRDGRLVGHAKDPLTVGLAVQDALADDHFGATGGHVFILGAGGSGLALTWYLAGRADTPARITVVDTVPERLDHLVAIHGKRQTRAGLITAEPATVANIHRIMDHLPAHSLIVNATGLGKDRPGSPLPPGVSFPREAVVWDFNYRGTLEFIAQARSQAQGAVIIDGWRYFIHGWTQVIAEVFDLQLTSELVDELAAAAAEVR